MNIESSESSEQSYTSAILPGMNLKRDPTRVKLSIIHQRPRGKTLLLLLLSAVRQCPHTSVRAVSEIIT